MKFALKTWMNAKVGNWLFALACGVLVIVAVGAKLRTDELSALADEQLQILLTPVPASASAAGRLAPGSPGSSTAKVANRRL